MRRPSPPRFRFLAPLPAVAACAAGLLSGAPPARAGLGAWTPTGISGGTVSVLAVSPSDPEVFYAGTPRSGVFRTVDAAGSWAPASAGLADGDGAFPPIASLEVDPRRPETVYAGTSGAGAYRSADGGRSWSRCGGLPPAGLAARVHDLQADPTATGVVFAATQEGVVRSRDGCRSWARRRDGLPALPVVVLGFDPAGRVLYAGLQGGGLYRSSDQGGRWQKAGSGLPPFVRSLGFDPRSPSVVFAGTSGGLYRSADGGRSWARAGAAAIVRPVLGVGFQESTEAVYAATRERVYVSSDRGATWGPTAGMPAVPELISFAIAPDWLLGGTNEDRRGGGVFRSPDGGASWPSWTSGISTLRPVGLAFHPTAPDPLYTSFGPAGVATGGRSSIWHHWPLGPADPAITVDAIEMHPGLPGVLFAGSASGPTLLRSDGADGNWRRLTPPPNGSMAALASDPRAAGALWTGGFGSVYRTPDGGETWEPLPFTSEVYPVIQDIEVAPSDPSTVTYAGARIEGNRPPRFVPSLYRTTDGGATWRPLPTQGLEGSRVYRFVTDRDDPAVSYAATELGLFRTASQGAAWKKLLPFDGRPGDVAATAGAIYAGRGPSVLRSTDRGESWTAIRSGLGARPVEKLWIDPFDPRHLYAGTSNAGIYEYTLPPAP